VSATTGSLRADEPFDYFRNSWSVIGLKDYARGTRITPQNKLLIDDSNEVGATVQVRFGRALNPLSRRQTKRLLDGWLPINLIIAKDECVRYEFTLWATPLPTVKDWEKAFDWPTEGENFLNWIWVRVTNTGDTATEAKVQVETTGPSRSGSNDFIWSLDPGKSAEAVVRIPFHAMNDPLLSFDEEGAELWLNRTVQYWRGIKKINTY